MIGTSPEIAHSDQSAEGPPVALAVLPLTPLAAEWKAIDEAIEKDWTENAERRDPLRGLRGQN